MISENKNSSNKSNSSTSRTTFKNTSLINSTSGQIFGDSHGVIESDWSSSMSIGTYDNIILPDDTSIRLMTE